MLSGRHIVAALTAVVVALTIATLVRNTRPAPAQAASGLSLAAADQAGGQVVVSIAQTERLAWEQSATDVRELDALRFVAYVDGQRTDLHDVTCASDSSPSGFACTSSLPAMSPGEHSIAIAALAEGREGQRSNVVVVRVRSIAEMLPLTFTTTDQIALRAELVAEGLDEPMDLQALPDGRVLIAERRGRVRVMRDGAIDVTPAIALEEVETGTEGGLLSIAVDRNFEQTRAIFVLYTAASGARLARLTMTGDTLSAHAVLLDGLPMAAKSPTAAMRSGPDGKLYMALDAGGDPARIDDQGSLSGKVLRLNTDGTTPADQRAASPVYATGAYRSPGLTWSRDALWTIGTDPEDRNQLRLVRGAGPPRQGIVAEDRLLPAGTGPTSVVAYLHDAIPALRGDLLIAASAAQGILRVPTVSSPSRGDSELLLQGQLGRVRAVEVAAGGVIYACTANALVRITAAP